MELPFFGNSGSGGDEALRWLAIAEKLLTSRDLMGSKSFATRAREANPQLISAYQILAIVDTLMASEKRVNNNLDWYLILQLQPTHDTVSIATQYRRLAILLNPQKNQLPFAAQAFRLVVEAYAILSNNSRKRVYDSEVSSACRNGERTEVVESFPSTTVTLSLAEETANIVRSGIRRLWSCICASLEGKPPADILREEAGAMIAFEAMVKMGSDDIPELRYRLTSLFERAKEVQKSLVGPTPSISELSQELATQVKFAEELSVKLQDEVQKAEVLEAEAAELEARARASRQKAEDQRSVVAEASHQQSEAVRGVQALKEAVQADQGKLLKDLTSELGVLRQGLIGLV